jgi:hypothetical protein
MNTAPLRSSRAALALLGVLLVLSLLGCSKKEEAPTAANGGTYYKGPMPTKAKPDVE